MISANVVQLITEYLDKCEAEPSEATLVGICWYVDGSHKTLPFVEEVNEALRQRPRLRVQRKEGQIYFGSEGTDLAITQADMEVADRQYRRQFATRLKELRVIDN